MKYSCLICISALLSIAYAATIYEIDTVTSHQTVDVTRTVCSNDDCTSTTKVQSTTVITTTVDGVATVYTSHVPVNASPKSLVLKPTTSSESDEYVDITSTPYITVSTGVKSTVIMQHSYTTYYNSSLALDAFELQFDNKAVNKAAFGVAAVAGIMIHLL